MTDGDGDRTSESKPASLPRRPFLGALGGAAVTPALAGCFGQGGDGGDGGNGTDAESGEADDGQDEADGADDGEGEDGAGGDEEAEEDGWDEAATDERIREHRTAPLEVEVVDADGEPVEGAAVDVAMQDHEFGFGVAVDAGELIERTDPGDEYREHVSDLFNTAVLENHHKWRFFEENQGLADDATAWLIEEGLDMRGHVCLWAAVDVYAVPEDVVEAMGVAWSDQGIEESEPDPEYVRERTFEHIETIISHYADFREHGSVIDQWDVVNEVVHEPAMIRAIEGEDVDPVEAPVLAEWYEHAEEVAPDDVATDVNDYDTMAGPNLATRDLYNQQIEYLTGEEVGVDGIGLQSHFDESGSLTPEQIREGLDRYAEHGLDVRITEFDMADPGWDEEDKAEFFRQYLKIAFGHPAVTDFLMWGFWDGNHWRDDAPLFYEDWEPKPTHDVYTGLVYDEWWTEESGETDGEGRLAVEEAFRGEYEVVAERDGETVTETVSVGAEGATVELSFDG